MKRSDIQVGQELAFSRDNDWASSPYRIEKVTVADTRGFFPRRAGFRSTNHPDLELQDGTTARGDFYAVDPSKSTCLVRRHNGDLLLVPLSQLRGEYDACHTRCVEAAAARAKYDAEVKAARENSAARVVAAGQALKDLGVNVGYLSPYNGGKLELGPQALEQILALLAK
jgi:hypothetical protein